MFTDFFIRRPIVASVISILIVLIGAITYPSLPVAQYPDITPPVIQVTATYPGASAQVIADTVAAPIEQKVNGVPGMIYMESTSASDGSYTLKVSFELGTVPDMASVLVQNKVSTALPSLPEDVKRIGVTTDKVSSNIITILSVAPKKGEPEGKFSDLFLSNWMTVNLVDEIKRIPGVGDAKVYPVKDYSMRVWLDPERLKARALTVVDVINALKEQNVQVAAGVIGQQPAPAGTAFQYNVSTLGRLSSVDEFENVIVRAEGSRVIRVKDVARVELGGKSYDTGGRYEKIPAAVMIVYQAPGGNAVQVAKDVQSLMTAKTPALPEGTAFDTVYDTSKFVLSAIDAVFHTFFEALALVLAVVLIFLGSLRSSFIPMLAIPVSIIGTFFFCQIAGFSVNLPVLFGLVLAIGIVVDDAIVVVENVERVMKEFHLPPKEATSKAMGEVLGACISIGLVLMAVFVPTAFLPGISGSLFRQFALTIAASTGLSVLCAVTLSPALCGVILKAHAKDHKPNFFNRGFNWMFDKVSTAYGNFIRFIVHPGVIAFTLAGFAACTLAVVWSFTQVPTGFVPLEDRGVVLAEIWMPDAASLERTIVCVERVEEAFATTDGIRNYTSIPGLSMINGAGSNYALLFGGLEDFDERLPRGRGLDVIMAELKQKVAKIPDGIVIIFTLPAVDGVGQASGFDLRVQDRGSVGRETLGAVVREFVVDGNAQSKLRNVNSAFRSGVPQLFADVDRERVKQMGIPLQDVFSTLSGYLGSAYVNDLNLFGRTWQLNVSADSRFRATAADVNRLEVRSPSGKMVPLGTMVDVRDMLGPDRIIRYNLFPSAIVQGVPGPGVSSGESLDLVEDMAKAKLPSGMSAEWTALSYQEKQIGSQTIVVFAMALIIVYLILAALYESWTVPLSVILSIPLAVLGAMGGLMLRGMDNNVYTQVGLVLLVGLGAKNAILIVEFAKALREQGKGIVEAAAESSRQRLRPILMTALAFILGVLPMMIAKGAGAASQQAIGTAVFYGMIGNTVLGLVFTPVLYVVIQAVREKFVGPPKPAAVAATAGAPAHAASAAPGAHDEHATH